MDVALPSRETSHDFFRRARARLSLDVPPALDDHAAPATRGDLDLDQSRWERAGVQATRPAAVTSETLSTVRSNGADGSDGGQEHPAGSP